MPAALSHALPRLIHSDLGQPGRKQCSAFKLRKALESAGVSILNNILRLLSVLNYGSRDAVQALIISADDHLVELVLACDYTPYQIRIVYCIRLIIQSASNYLSSGQSAGPTGHVSERRNKLSERQDRKLIPHAFHGFGDRTPVLSTKLLEE